MYAGTCSVYPKNRKQRQKNRPRLEKPAAPALTSLAIPCLGDVPTHHFINHEKARVAKTILALMELGLVSENDVAEPWQAESEILQRSLTRWAEKEGQGLNLFSPVLCIGDMPDGVVDAAELDDNQIAIGISSCDALYGLIGENTTIIEKEAPGLGETLLHYLDRALWTTLFAVTPASCLELAKQVYWMGEDDEQLVVEEAALSGENIDDLELFRKSDYLSTAPEWAADPLERLRETQLVALAKSENPLVRAAAHAAIDLAAVLKNQSFTPPSWGEGGYADPVNPAICLRWSEDDHVLRVFDDHYEYVIQTEGASDLHGLYTLQNSKEGLREALDNLSHLFARLRAAEQAINVIATFESQ